ncbi:hemotin [Drosophila persimilis]|uniref:hemotin n=1 Tax=Drosophila persimilis TaxID=7234 RepID=UPI000F07DB4E|nr:hemotin [Drosophila persimilis]
MDWSMKSHLLAYYYYQCPNISPWCLILFGGIVAVTLVCYSCHCYQFIRDRRRLRSQNRQLPQPLVRLSVSPGCPHIINTKLTHSKNLAEAY